MAASALITKLLALVLGIVIGVIGTAALVPKLSPSAVDVSNNSKLAEPTLYGKR